jgi:hypothetical protein
LVVYGCDRGDAEKGTQAAPDPAQISVVTGTNQQNTKSGHIHRAK